MFSVYGAQLMFQKGLIYVLSKLFCWFVFKIADMATAEMTNMLIAQIILCKLYLN